jgi:hypothetical protein
MLTGHGHAGRMNRRWRAMVRRWPPQIARACESHLRSLHQPGGSAHSLPPYWVSFALAYGEAEHIPPRRVQDILWGVTCLSTSIRIQDDVFDRDLPAGLSLFAATLLQLQATEIFVRLFPARSAFWRWQSKLIATTVGAIARTDEAHRGRTVEAHSEKTGKGQRGKNPSPDMIGHLYAKECAVFAIPLAAISALARNSRKLSNLLSAADELALVGQAIDDFSDLFPDLHEGKTNLAAAFLLDLPPDKRLPAKQVYARLVKQMLLGNRLSLFFAYLLRHLDTAEKHIKPLRLAGAHDYIAEYRSTLLKWEEAIQKRAHVSQI